MTLLRALRSVSRETVLLPVHAWRLVSRFLPARCKFYPSCSSYALTAIRRHGVVRGLPMAAWRVMRCHPWSLGGVDHVPPARCRGSAACGEPHDDAPAPPAATL